MSETPQLSEAKRVLLEKYLNGDLLRTVKTTSGIHDVANVEMTSYHNSAIAIQTGGLKRPFFYLHGEWRGKAFYCYPLAQGLGADQPFYILEPYTFDGLRVPPKLETIAKVHLEALRTIQPEGPYLLGGWCNGALVAYEIARQLNAQGQVVDLLVLIDGMLPGRHRMVRTIIDHLCSLLRLGQEQQLDLFLIVHHIYRFLRFSHYRQRIYSEQRERNSKLSKGSFGILRLNKLFTSAEVLRQDYSKVFEWVTAGYAPDLYADKITFFWVSEARGLVQEWREVLKAKEGEVEIYFIPGNDITSRTEYLSDFAEKLSICLDVVQRAASTQGV